MVVGGKVKVDMYSTEGMTVDSDCADVIGDAEAVIIDRSRPPEKGDIICCCIEGEIILKRYDGIPFSYIYGVAVIAWYRPYSQNDEIKVLTESAPEESVTVSASQATGG